MVHRIRAGLRESTFTIQCCGHSATTYDEVDLIICSGSGPTP